MSLWVLFGTFWAFLGARFLGSGPGRGRSPVEWGEILFVRPFARLSFHPSPPSPQTLLGGPQASPTGPQTSPAGPQIPLAGLETPPAGSETPPAGPH